MTGYKLLSYQAKRYPVVGATATRISIVDLPRPGMGPLRSNNALKFSIQRVAG